MKHVIKHNLDLARSRQLMEGVFADYQRRYAKYNPSFAWLDERRAWFGFVAKGVRISGTADLQPGAIEVDMEVPLVLRVFKQRALDVIDREVNRILAESEKPAPNA